MPDTNNEAGALRIILRAKRLTFIVVFFLLLDELYRPLLERAMAVIVLFHQKRPRHGQRLVTSNTHN